MRPSRSLEQRNIGFQDPDRRPEAQKAGTTRTRRCIPLRPSANTPTPLHYAQILDKNQLKNLELLPKIPSLETLWLNNNRLTSLAGTIIVLQKQAPNLKFLSLMRNPLCPEMYFQDGSLDSAYERYRLMIIAKFPKLKGLDATPVSSSERKQAAQMGETLEIKQPKKHTMSTGSETDFVKKADFSPPKKPAAFLAKGHMRYNGNYSEGNRFILNTDL